uniref:Protein kinase domain-containing protein n=1 Tax=Clytia hemisphaerica TaxID=252671 RepID=A0A7M5XIS9_9CNID
EKIGSMVEELKSIDEIFKQIGEQLSSRFGVTLNLKIPDLQNDTQEPTSDVERSENDISDKVEYDQQQENEKPRSKRFKWNVEEVPIEEQQKKKIERLQQVNREQTHTINVLREKNASLCLTSASYTHQKMVDQLGQTRSASLVDASLFSNSFHTGDSVLQKQEPVFLGENEFNLNFKGLRTTNLPSGSFSDVKRYFFSGDDDETVAVKCMRTDIFGYQVLAVLSHEHRLLAFAGRHKNIVRTMGLVRIGGALSHVMYYQDGTRLDLMIQKSTLRTFFIFKELIEGIACGLNFLFSKGIIHNNLVPENIILKDWEPVIVGFSFACRSESVKPKVSKFLMSKFPEQKHFAPEIFTGSPVSFSTDVYAFGVLVERILRATRDFKLDDILKSRIDCFATAGCQSIFDYRERADTLLERVRAMFAY